ncbi:cyclophilin [Emydomyces testavorans]|uniref:Cyclophilin n=1 Tax=Emydomyces testavorans TaxID=2070801 RepID=A0AAF0IHC8_9EURO|nr:cyclophilin [Emydomyces testavorans]
MEGNFNTFMLDNAHGSQTFPAHSAEKTSSSNLGENMEYRDSNRAGFVQCDDQSIPDLGTDTFARMSDQEFLALFTHHDTAGADETSNFNLDNTFMDHAFATQANRSFMPQAYTNILPGHALGGPTASGLMPFTDLEAIDKQAKAMVQTMGHIRVQTSNGLEFLRQQHNQSLVFYMDCLEKPTDEGNKAWDRYLEEMRLSYNMLRDYQMQAYKSMCGSLRIWLRYYYRVVKPETLQSSATELRQYAAIQRQIFGYRLPEWHEHPALVFGQENAPRTSSA